MKSLYLRVPALDGFAAARTIWIDSVERSGMMFRRTASSSRKETVPEPLGSAAANASSSRSWWHLLSLLLDCELRSLLLTAFKSTTPELVEVRRSTSISSSKLPSFSMRRILRSAADSNVSLATMVLWDIVDTMEGGSTWVKSPMSALSMSSASARSSCSASRRRTASARSSSSPLSCAPIFAARRSRVWPKESAISLVEASSSCCWRQTFLRASCFRWFAVAWPCQMSMQEGQVTHRKPWQMRTRGLSNCMMDWEGCWKVMLAKSENGRP
mmetsp:Transcript_51749/g.104050  ORF Transcript_51749/g.104050 Transcript_51749/m.104050 type:complete len:271 (-) Transcript_51749:484-1296(-)